MENENKIDFETLSKEEIHSKTNNQQSSQMEKVEISYFRPKFRKRVSAIFLDALIFAFASLAIFILVNKIVVMQPNYIAANNELNTLKEQSGLFLYNSTQQRYQDVVTYYNEITDMSPGALELKYKEHINNFLIYLSTLDDDGKAYDEVKKSYDDYRIDPELTYDSKPYFVKDDQNNVLKNKEIPIPSKAYVDNVYKPYIDKYALAFFVTKVPNALEIQKYQSNLLFFLEIPIGVTLGYFLTYFVPPMIFSRGRKTIGRLAFNLGLVDFKTVLNVGAGKYTIRFLIMFFAEIVLSVFTLCIPLLISFTMMSFSKKKQLFHDYMLGIDEVDTENSKIYKNLEEISKKPVEKDDYLNFRLGGSNK